MIKHPLSEHLDFAKEQLETLEDKILNYPNFLELNGMGGRE